jgi:hypothetical protein
MSGGCARANSTVTDDINTNIHGSAISTVCWKHVVLFIDVVWFVVSDGNMFVV